MEKQPKDIGSQHKRETAFPVKKSMKTPAENLHSVWSVSVIKLTHQANVFRMVFEGHNVWVMIEGNPQIVLKTPGDGFSDEINGLFLFSQQSIYSFFNLFCSISIELFHLWFFIYF